MATSKSKMGMFSVWNQKNKIQILTPKRSRENSSHFNWVFLINKFNNKYYKWIIFYKLKKINSQFSGFAFLSKFLFFGFFTKKMSSFNVEYFLGLMNDAGNTLQVFVVI
jgi:hypothetical protein